MPPPNLKNEFIFHDLQYLKMSHFIQSTIYHSDERFIMNPLSMT
jgi:hypothetical protein